MTGHEPGDFFVAPAPERPFLAEADAEPGPAADRGHDRAAGGGAGRSRCAPRPHARRPSCSRSSGTTSSRRRRRGGSTRCSPHFIRVWQVGPATAGIDDLSLLEPINRALAEDARATASPDLAAARSSGCRRLVRRDLAFWSDVDVVLTPTLALPPVPIGWTYEDTDGDAASRLRPADALHPVHAARERHRPAGRVAAAALEPAGAPDRRPADREAVRGRDADPARRAARAGAPVGRPPPAGVLAFAVRRSRQEHGDGPDRTHLRDDGAPRDRRRVRDRDRARQVHRLDRAWLPEAVAARARRGRPPGRGARDGDRPARAAARAAGGRPQGEKARPRQRPARRRRRVPAGSRCSAASARGSQRSRSSSRPGRPS